MGIKDTYNHLRKNLNVRPYTNLFCRRDEMAAKQNTERAFISLFDKFMTTVNKRDTGFLGEVKFSVTGYEFDQLQEFYFKEVAKYVYASKGDDRAVLLEEEIKDQNGAEYLILSAYRKEYTSYEFNGIFEERVRQEQEFIGSLEFHLESKEKNLIEQYFDLKGKLSII